MTDLVAFLVWALAVWGASNGIAFSNLLTPFRYWLSYRVVNDPHVEGGKSTVWREWPIVKALPGKLVQCPMCLGFWLGFLSSLLAFSPARTFLHVNFVSGLVVDSFLGSACSWAIHLLLLSKQFPGKEHQHS